MTKSRAALTELEGAILGVLRQAPGSSPYAVRKVFQTSRSAEWSGSAGAVYPAIARLAAGGLVKDMSAGDKRGTTTYALTAAGTRAHDRWLSDVARATGPGMDPFRTRAGLWSLLPPRERRTLLRQLDNEITGQSDAVARRLPTLDDAERTTEELLLALLDIRLAWLRARR
jgi:DNA-binding PadR family transcriptional regulator